MKWLFSQIEFSSLKSSRMIEGLLMIFGKVLVRGPDTDREDECLDLKVGFFPTAFDWLLIASKGNIPFFETSAKEDFLVDIEFMSIARTTNYHEQVFSPSGAMKSVPFQKLITAFNSQHSPSGAMESVPVQKLITAFNSQRSLIVASAYKISLTGKVQRLVKGIWLKSIMSAAAQMDILYILDQFNGESSPVILALNEKEIIKGLKEVIIGMKAGGKLNRGLSVVDSYNLLKGEELTEDELFLS
ncbi:hypothetical protein L1887_43239 [Cichorium endivia]|nr:hypothetical protein L1887_43239 [Cichorium endivia]